MQDSNLIFNPNLTPGEIIEAGSFGGSYFGLPIEEYTNYDYQELFNKHFDGVDTKLYLGEEYKPRLNKFKIRSGMDYQYWKDMGWMHKDDPYGWFEWYCKYSLGRRHEDDERQIKRWNDFCGVNGRWRRRIYKIIDEAGGYNNNESKWIYSTVSPRIQQSLQHWGYRINKKDYESYKRERGGA